MGQGYGEPGKKEEERLDTAAASSSSETPAEQALDDSDHKDGSEDADEQPPELIPANDVGAGCGGFPPLKLKSTVLQNYYGDLDPPSLQPSTSMASSLEERRISSSSLQSASVHEDDDDDSDEDGSEVEVGEEDAEMVCIGCNKSHPRYGEYPFKFPSPPDRKDSPQWIHCDACDSWIHTFCSGIEHHEVEILESFACLLCQAKGHQSQPHVWVALHRRYAEDPEGIDKPVEVGTAPWVEEFVKTEATKYPAPPPEFVKLVATGHEFNRTFRTDAAWNEVFLVHEKDGLGLGMPEPGAFGLDDIIATMGESYQVDTIDVHRQKSMPMSLGYFRKCFNATERPRLYNILSLEFTDTEYCPRNKRSGLMASFIYPPAIVGELSWAERYWPHGYNKTKQPLPVEEQAQENHALYRPKVELFALISMAGSFTDWHVDFGGSSVWYHVYKGCKVFYIARPTKTNLNAYHKLQKERDDHHTFLADILPEGSVWRVQVNPGETLLIPAGWIHAVLTPVDSLVFGGNFLNDLCVPLQMEIHAHELDARFESRFVYPQFELTNWYAARTFAEYLQENIDDDEKPKYHILAGAHAFADNLKAWIDRDKVQKKWANWQYRAFIHGDTPSQMVNNLNRLLLQFEGKMSPSFKKRKPPIISTLSNKSPKKMTKDGVSDRPKPARHVGVKKRTIRYKADEGEVNDEWYDYDEEEPGVKVRISLDVGQTDKKEPLRLKVKRSSTMDGDAPKTPALRINMEGAPKIVTEADKRSIDGIDMVNMFASRTSSGRKSKPAAWLQDQFGTELATERERIEASGEEETLPRGRLPAIAHSYDELDEAERREEGLPPKKKKKLSSSPNKATAVPQVFVPKKPVNVGATPKQRLAAKMKNLRKM